MKQTNPVSSDIKMAVVSCSHVNRQILILEGKVMGIKNDVWITDKGIYNPTHSRRIS